MVLPDPQWHFDDKNDEGSHRVPSVFDRLFALLIDFFIFGPVVGLSVAFLVRDFRVLSLTNVDSMEIEILWCLIGGGGILLTLFLDATFTYFWGATPGQRFAQVEVRSWPTQDRLTYPQCLARSFLWLLSIPLIVPLLGAYTDRRRRTFHDRATETMLCTLKTDANSVPVEMEIRFFRSWSHMFLLFALVALTAMLVETHRALRNGVFRREGALQEGVLCPGIEASTSGVHRLDLAIAGFLAGHWERDCLEREADFSLWRAEKEELPFAQLAKGLSFDEDSEASPYFAKACELEPKGEACGMARFMTSSKDHRDRYLREGGLTTLSSRMLLLRDSISRNELPAAAGLIKGLRGQEMLTAWLNREEVRTFWKMREKSNKGRQPASSETRDLLEDFKKRYELP